MSTVRRGSSYPNLQSSPCASAMFSQVLRPRRLPVPATIRCHHLIKPPNPSIYYLARERTVFSRPCTRKISSSSSSSSSKVEEPQNQSSPAPIYNGPLTRTFRTLKIFSLSSMGLATALTPFSSSSRPLCLSPPASPSPPPPSSRAAYLRRW